MRIAVLSDIHGNCVALDAVLADIDSNNQEAVDEYWILGDLAAAGAQPLEVMERLDDLRTPGSCAAIRSAILPPARGLLRRRWKS